MNDRDDNHAMENGESQRKKNNGKSVYARWFERLSDALLGEPQDREQLLTLLRESEQRHLLDHQALRMMEGVLRISELHVRDIMIPRSQMVEIDWDASLEQFLPMVIESGHSRFPVIGENRDEVVGILLGKDLLRYALKGESLTVDISEILRPVFFVPESKRLDVLLVDFRQKFTHMAIVIDEYGAVTGLVTIEDILEQIVGEIEDEYDTEEDEENIVEQSDHTFLIKATTPIEEFNKKFNSALNEDEFDTIGGFVSHLFGRLPKVDESIAYDHLEFYVLNSDRGRIRMLQVTDKS